MDVVDKINKLKKERQAVILVHNYQRPEVQDIGDYLGDSLGLSRIASKTEAQVILFCGVYFMAETAKILSPQKTVLISDKSAGCPMADMITVEQLRELKKKHPQAKTICYVNSSAEVKAESDICCTSANATQVVQGATSPRDEIIFVPDQYLGRYTATQVERRFIFWQGYCPSHLKILPEYITELKHKHPQAEVLAHPECAPSVLVLADQVLSTSGMAKYAKTAKGREFIIATEEGLIYPLKKDNPDKEFYPVPEVTVCPNMKKTTLDKVVTCLENGEHEITLPADIIKRAQGAIRKMIEYV